MPSVNVRVYDTQSNRWEFDEVISVKTMQDVKNAIPFNSSARYTNKTTSKAAFDNLSEVVTGDVTIFKSVSKSKAG